MNRSRKLDIIIPTLNEEENLKKLLPYLKKHTSIDTKLYVIDSVQSTDNTRNICQEYDITYIKSNKAGRSIQMNEGAGASSGDILLFLHADVLPPVDFQKHILSAINEGYQAGLFAYKFDNNSLLLKINAFFTRFNGILAGGGDQCQFFTRTLFENNNGYKSEYEIMEDFEMIDRLKELNVPITIIKDPATVSARKYDNNSYLRVNIINLLAFIKYKRNVSSCELKKFYKKSLN